MIRPPPRRRSDLGVSLLTCLRVGLDMYFFFSSPLCDGGGCINSRAQCLGWIWNWTLGCNRASCKSEYQFSRKNI
jgi:hypothetical protein